MDIWAAGCILIAPWQSELSKDGVFLREKIERDNLEVFDISDAKLPSPRVYRGPKAFIRNSCSQLPPFTLTKNRERL